MYGITTLCRRIAVTSVLALSGVIATVGVSSAHDFCVVPVASGAGSPARAIGGAGDSAEVAATVEQYHQALASGDSAAVLALLTPGVMILESGGVETREEYRSHHLQSDIAFARAVRSARGPVRVSVRGDVAWATSTTTTRGEYRGRPIDSAGAELMVLTREAGGWKISAIHWSSRSRRS